MREQEAFVAGHLPGAMNVPRGQLELRVNGVFKDPGQRIVVYCELGIISTLTAAQGYRPRVMAGYGDGFYYPA